MKMWRKWIPCPIPAIGRVTIDFNLSKKNQKRLLLCLYARLLDFADLAITDKFAACLLRYLTSIFVRTACILCLRYPFFCMTQLTSRRFASPQGVSYGNGSHVLLLWGTSLWNSEQFHRCRMEQYNVPLVSRDAVRRCWSPSHPHVYWTRKNIQDEEI